MFQHQIHSIKPLTTAHMAQTMTLLGLTYEELRQKIESELAKNPALELTDDRSCPTCQRLLTAPGPCPICSRPKLSNNEEPIVFISSQPDYYIPELSNAVGNDSEEMPDDNIPPTIDLATYVLRQIATEVEIDDRPIVAHILSSLNEDGFLTIPTIEISHYHHVPASRVENLIRLIQKADPIGVGSANPKEALLIQLQILKENNYVVPDLAEHIIQDNLSLLSRHQYCEMAKRYNVTEFQIEQTAHFISTNLNPFPGRAHWGDFRSLGCDKPHTYQLPDIIISQLNKYEGNQLVVEILLPIRGTLQVNPLFRQIIKSAPEENVEKWERDLENASLLVKCIQQRNHTMQRMMKHITKHQKAFILNGEEYLNPTTRAEVARNLGVHESTISRAVSGKNVQLPTRKIIPLRLFFDRSLHIRAQLIDIIRSEKQPLTDSQLAERLLNNGIVVARRTVAKYRAMEGILPAHLRKKTKRLKET